MNELLGRDVNGKLMFDYLALYDIIDSLDELSVDELTFIYTNILEVLVEEVESRMYK